MTRSKHLANRTHFTTEKRPAVGSRGMVVTNHPLASAAAAEILLGGGNAVDATVAALLALTVVEPMMVGILGGGISHLRLPEGRHVIIDNLSTAPQMARADMFEPTSDGTASARDTRDRRNELGASAIAVPGALAGWIYMLERYGTRSLSDVIAPARRHAEDGFITTPYLEECISSKAVDVATDPGLAKLFLPLGKPLKAGSRLVQAEYAQTLKRLAEAGPGLLYDGELGAAVAAHVSANGGSVTTDDLAAYTPVERDVIRGEYRGRTIVGPPPPASSGLHIAQMLNILEGYDVAALQFGSPDGIHLLAETMKIAFADRSAVAADPDFIDAPFDRVASKEYAEERRASIDMHKAKNWSVGRLGGSESQDTTHVTVADLEGCVVASTQTINGLFGACVQIPGTGLIANNYMHNFDPHPERALSIAPGKRVFTSMAPMMVVEDDCVRFALGLPGALRIFPSALQAIVNLIDHQMELQVAIEAPRIWTDGGVLELEPGFPEKTVNALNRKGHTISRVNVIAGGMGAISFTKEGSMCGSACWRADGTPVGIAGGYARRGARFSTS